MIVVCVKTALNSRLYGFCEIQICIISNYTYKFLIMIMTASEKIPRKNVGIILANSLHFFFTAMKRWKFQNHCDHCDESSEFTKRKKLQF